MFYLLLVFTVLFSFSHANSASSLQEVLQKENSPASHSLLKFSQAVTSEQTATLRLSTPPRPLKAIDPNSPSYGVSPIQRERDALYPLMDYLQSHIPTERSPKLTRTPLNASTILRASLKNIKVGKDAHFHSQVSFSHNTLSQIVLQTHIELEMIGQDGRTNLERMKQGCAPLGPDQKPINLHHLNQEDGLLAEITSRTHKTHYGTLHTRLGTSHIDRNTFDLFRSAYWRHRAKEASVPKKPLAKNLFSSQSSKVAKQPNNISCKKKK